MSLKIFHLFFISLVLCLSVFLIIYGVHERTPLLLLFGGFLFISLIPYLYWFRKKMGKLSFFLIPVLFSANDLLACSVCFGDSNSLMVHGTRMGILFLVGLISLLLMGMTVIGFSWYKRSKKN
ncbi:MAG: hypothetical protein HYY44_00105 [Deltaproteobacteria bacterium]|nr:hypothetical protein [Deltaproteobacteria bacterium]MBI4374521.1 hypothetical protein [Deltaproteobacteria bacterium]